MVVSNIHVKLTELEWFKVYVFIDMKEKRRFRKEKEKKKNRNGCNKG